MQINPQQPTILGNVEDVRAPSPVGCGTAASAEHREGARWLVERLPNAQLHVSQGARHFAPRSHPMAAGAFTGEVATLARADPPYPANAQLDPT